MILRRNAWPYLALVAFTTVLALFVLKLPMSRLDVPYTFQGDAIDKLVQIKTVAETGWLFHNDRLGYPFGYDRLDFPRFDSLNYLFMGPIAALTGEPGIAINLYYVASFYLIAFAAFFSLRRLGLTTDPALLCTLLYAFLPYHVLRGVAHITNGAYFLVPPAMLALTWLARNRLDAGTPEARRSWLFALAIALLLPLQTPYNGFFFAYLCVIAGAVAMARHARWRTVIVTLSLMAATACAFLAEETPVLVHAMREGNGLFGLDRAPAAAQEYALQLNQVVLPTSKDRRPSLARAKREFEQAMNVPHTEVRDQYIGALGVLGLGALAWSLFRAVRIRDGDAITDAESATRVAALLAIAIVLLAIPSSLDTIVAYWITDKIRAYNRILPFLGFACLVGAGWALQAATQRIGRRWLRCAIIGVIGIVALFDIVVRPPFASRAEPIAHYDGARAYFRGVEQRLGNGAAVFQLPVVWYPENPPVNEMEDYDEFRPFLFTETLRFSYGVSRARGGYGWGKFVEALPAKDMIARSHAMGFAAILVDGKAYAPDARKALTDGLAQSLPEPPIVSDDQRWWAFALKNCCTDSVARADGHVGRILDYVPADGRLRFDQSGTGRFYFAGGWQEPEDWGVWGSGGEARLRMRMVPAPTGAITMTLDTNMVVGPNVPERRLHIECNGRSVRDVVYTQASPSQHVQIDLPSGAVGADGLVELRFVVTPAASPQSAGVSLDGRLLGIGLINLSIASVDPAP